MLVKYGNVPQAESRPVREVCLHLFCAVRLGRTLCPRIGQLVDALL
jgi:hypothetical protein